MSKRRAREKPWRWWRAAPNALTDEQIEAAKRAPVIVTPPQPASLRTYTVTVRGCKHYTSGHSRAEAEASAHADHDVYCRLPAKGILRG